MTAPHLPPIPPGPNTDLPAVNPLNLAQVRSSLAALLALAGILSQLMGGGVGEALAEISADTGVILRETDQAVAAINVLLITVGYVWTWLERKAPQFRLSFRAPLFRS